VAVTLFSGAEGKLWVWKQPVRSNVASVGVPENGRIREWESLGLRRAAVRKLANILWFLECNEICCLVGRNKSKLKCYFVTGCTLT